MNYAALALGFAFAAVGLVMRANAGRAPDAATARNPRLASTLMLFAAAAFFVAFAVSAVRQ